MSDGDFKALRDQMFDLHGGGRYVEALALVEHNAPRFPDQWADILFWLMCLRAAAGDTGGAIASLAEGVERGHWWAETTLRGDPDLRALQGDARFETLAAVCRRRHEEAQAGAQPELLVFAPPADPPWPLLIALHGAGGMARPFAEHWQPAVDAGWLVALPQSSLLWGPDRYAWTDRAQAVAEVSGHFRSLVGEYPVDPGRVVLAGMSQGGIRALEMILAGSLPARGFFGVACAPGDLDAVRAAAGDAARGELRFYLTLGDKDFMFERGRQFMEILEAAGVAARLEVRPGLGHDIPPDFARSLGTGLAFVLG